jgi:hypothetical protein
MKTKFIIIIIIIITAILKFERTLHLHNNRNYKSFFFIL